MLLRLVPKEGAKVNLERYIVYTCTCSVHACDLHSVYLQATLAPPPVVQAPLPTEPPAEPELVGESDGMGLAIGIVSTS